MIKKQKKCLKCSKDMYLSDSEKYWKCDKCGRTIHKNMRKKGAYI